MSSFGQVPLRDVWEMLKKCAPGHTVIARTHNYCIYYGDKTYPTLPKKHQQVDSGQIKKMARHLGILDCARQALSI